MVSPEAIEKAKALINKSETNRQYFFRKVPSADWVRPLWQAGFFRNPPEGGAFWPESHCLVRMATEDSETVYAVVMEIPQTENVTVHRDLLDIATKMSEEKGAKIALKFLPSFRRMHFSWISDELCELIESLAAGSHSEDALALATALLEVLPPSRGDDEDAAAARSILAQCRTHLPPYEYETCTHRLAPVLAAGAGIRAITMFGDLLSQAICFEEHAEAGGPEDFSAIWAPAFDGPGPEYSDPKRVLAYALSDNAKTVMQERPKERPQVLAYLRKGAYKVFWRIELHLLRFFPDESAERINAVLGSREYYDDGTLEREYRQLLAAEFKHLRPEVQKHYLAWVEELFDFPKEEERFRHFFGEKIPEDDVKSLARRRALERLWGLREELPENWRTRYDSLVKEVGEPDSPNAPPEIAEAPPFAPISPKTAVELEAMSETELLDFLRQWKRPPREIAGDWPFTENLGRELQQVVKCAPSRFTGMVDEIRRLDPTYVYHVLAGLQDALGGEVQIDWEPTLRLCLSVVQKSTESIERKHFDAWQGPGLLWAKDSAARLVATGLRSHFCPLPLCLREEVWSVIKSFTKSPDPSVEDDKRAQEEGNSLLDRAINSRRGRAMETVVQYALWLRRNFERSDELKPQIESGLDAMPEVREVMNLHLEPQNDPSPAVRTVYGRYFPWLVLLDEAWAGDARKLVFPVKEELRELYCAAWGAYLISCSPYDKVVEILREEYLSAIDYLGKPWPVKILQGADPDGRLAEHLVQLYARGAIQADDELWQRFWEKGPDAIRAHALSFIGRTIDTEKKPLAVDVRDRFIALAQERIKGASENADKSAFIKEMRALGWWFANAAFDEEWALTNLDRVLDITGGQIDAEFSLAERLAHTAPQFPKLAVTCVRKMIKGTTEVWGILGQHDQLRTILRATRDSSDAFIEAKAAINILVSKGFDNYREILEPNN